MFLQRQRASVLTQALQIQLRRYTQSSAAVLLQPDPELDPDLESTTSFPIPDPKFVETIFAVPRTTSGKSISAKERKAGRVPSIIFEQEDGQHGGNKRLVSVRTNRIRKLVGHLGCSFFLSRLFDLEVRSDFASKNDVVERVRVLPRSGLETLWIKKYPMHYGVDPAVGKGERTRSYNELYPLQFLCAKPTDSEI